MKYSIVIPTYNHCKDLLQPCIESVLQYSNVVDIELIISANGCTDSTFEYIASLQEKFNYLGLSENFKYTWSTAALGYSRATNAGIQLATTDKIVLLNNDTVLLGQNKNDWLNILNSPFDTNPKCGITCIIKGPSEPAGRDFAVFFCVMIHKKVFDKIGLLNTDYGVGGGEDTEFCIEAEDAGFEVVEAVAKQWSPEAQLFVGDFPIYHKGEGTVHDTTLVPNYTDVFLENSLRLAKKYNPKWYQWKISNNSERAVFLKGDPVFPREKTRYEYAAKVMSGKNIFELGCSSGFGIQFLPSGTVYTGLDYDKYVIEAAQEQGWNPTINTTFICGDINQTELGQYDTIIAFEVIEHLINGLDVVERLKKHCNTLVISVPMLESMTVDNPHHKIFMLSEKNFPGFEFKYIDTNGNLLESPSPDYNVMLCTWRNPNAGTTDLSWLHGQNPLIYNEVIGVNQYQLTSEKMHNRNVIDIGANIGMFSLLAASLGAKKVITVEPISDTFAKMVDNINFSGYKTIIPLKNLVSSVSGEIKNVSLNENTGANSMYNVADKFEAGIATITLADILSQFDDGNVFLKLDCEGAEYDIILNASDADMTKITEIVMEIHTDLHPIYKGTSVIENKLLAFGFTKIKADQIYTWDIDHLGNQINWRECPYSNQYWKK